MESPQSDDNLQEFLKPQVVVDKKKSWWPFGNLNLPSPGSFDALALAAKEPLFTSDRFDGFRVELSKMVNEGFNVSHSIIMGSSEMEPTYMFLATVASQKAQVQARIDTEYNSGGKFVSRLGPVELGITLQTNPDNLFCSLEAEYSKFHRVTGVKWSSMENNFQFSYCQSLTKNLAVGAEMVYNDMQGKLTTSYAGRYSKGNQIFSITAAPGIFQSINYAHKVSDKVTIASELASSSLNRKTQVAAQFGIAYNLRMSTFRGYFDTNRVVSSIIEEQINNLMKFSVSGSIDYAKKMYKLGMGISIQM